jgi:hypothetical protein
MTFAEVINAFLDPESIEVNLRLTALELFILVQSRVRTITNASFYARIDTLKQEKKANSLKEKATRFSKVHVYVWGICLVH